MALSLDDFADRVLKPRVSQLAASIDADVANSYKDIFQSVGTPGTTPATSLVLLQAQQKLNEAAAVMSPRYATVNPAANAGLVEGMKGLFNPTSTISRQFKNGMMGEGILGYEEINMSQSIKVHTTGSALRSDTPIVKTTLANGATTLTLDNVTDGNTLVPGDVFTIAGVFAVNPQTRESTGSLQQFVVQNTVTSASTEFVDVDFLPAVYAPTQALATVTALPAAGDVVTFLGAASTGYPQNLIYHKDAITFATADLMLPQGVDMASRKVHNGISMRIVRQYDINNDRMPCRIDVLYGYSVIRPQMAVRMWG
jgi:hypothetical protein